MATTPGAEQHEEAATSGDLFSAFGFEAHQAGQFGTVGVGAA